MGEEAISALATAAPEQRKVDERALQLSFDLYERYDALKQVFHQLFPAYQHLSILDVGGNSPYLWPGFSSLVKTFFPDAECTIVDVEVASGVQSGVQASGLELPFAANTFDAVCALDTLEHIPEASRQVFIDELLRVSRDIVYLTFPYKSAGNIWAERLIGTYVDEVLQSPLVQLQEHRDLGLPESSSVEAYLSTRKVAVAKRGHGNVDIWAVMMLASHTLRVHSVDMLHDLSTRFNREFAAHDWTSPTYRMSYLLSKLKAADRLNSAFLATRSQAGADLRLAEVLGLVREFAESGVAPQIILDKDRHIRNLETLRSDLVGAVDAKERHIQNLQRGIEDKDRHIINLEAELAAVKRQAAITAELQLRLQRMEEVFGQIKERQSSLEADSRGLAQRLATNHQHLQEIFRGELQDSARQQQGLAKRVAAQELLTSQLLSSRTWRTLQALGSVAKWVTPTKIPEPLAAPVEKTADIKSAPVDSAVEVPAALEESQARTGESELIGGVSSKSDQHTHSKELYFVCDEPSPNDKRPRNRTLIIRGWALGEEHLDYVELEIPGLPSQQVYVTAPRPDVKHNFPDLDKTGRSGFSASIDTQALPNGRHTLRLRLVGDAKVFREIETEFLIDHSVGYASDYEEWIAEFEAPANEIVLLKASRLEDRPLISIVMPVFNTEPDELRAAIDSVISQTYSSWELCVVDDGSTRTEVRAILFEFTRRHPNIKVSYLPERGGIAAALNAGVRLTSGEYLTFLDHDDTLSPYALMYVVEAINHYPDADLIYSDEDKLDEHSQRYQPFFKPDWSPDLMLSINYICHLLVMRRELMDVTGEFCSDTDGSQDYDYILRASEHAKQILHIPHVLYHWRAGPNSTASSVGSKPYTMEASRRALERYCKRNGTARVEPGAVPGSWRVRYSVPENPRISIIIAAGGTVDILMANLDALFTRTEYKNFEVVVIDNSASGDISNLVVDFAGAGHTIRYIDWTNKPFNYSQINNVAARQCDSAILLFLNDDVSAIRSDWLTALVELVARPEVGAVGAKLLFPNGMIQHAGVVMGLFDNCGHAFHGQDGGLPHYFAFSDVIRNVSAVTGACLITKAEVFWKAGGFDEDRLAVAFNDVDLCLKIGALGYRVLFTPFALLYHHESFSKTQKDFIPHPAEVAVMQAKWREVIAADPYYSPNLTRRKADYSLPTLWV